MRIGQNGVMYNSSHTGFLALRRQCVNRWHSMLVSQKVNVGITAIHFFKKPGLDTFYQRHGIATCSASLGGGMAVGAVFFGDKLPALNTSSLVSRGVPVSHLKAGLRRQDHRLPPEQSFNVGRCHSSTVLMMTFSFGSLFIGVIVSRACHIYTRI